MKYTAIGIGKILGIEYQPLPFPLCEIETITTDTRNTNLPESTIFFALPGSINDGHDFVNEAVSKGIKNIVISRNISINDEGVNIFMVEDTLKALQKLAAYHRMAFPTLEVLAITGSNGKTTVKEWLSQLIHDRRVVKSPKSYNSQTGVALSLWQISEGDRLGIFEAGISKVGEMETLEKMIKPDVGLFTMIGDAHAEGFQSRLLKLSEKLKLFKNTKTIIFCEDDIEVSTAIKNMYKSRNLMSWGRKPESSLFVVCDEKHTSSGKVLTISYQSVKIEIIVPFVDRASIDNALHCLATLLILGIPIDEAKSGLMYLHNLPMRLELKNGIHGSILVNDTYNADIQSFRMAMDFVHQQGGKREKLAIISDFKQTGLTPSELYHSIAYSINNLDVRQVIGIGTDIRILKNYLNPNVVFQHFENTEALLQHLPDIDISQKMILVKGARIFKLEQVIDALTEKMHTAILETDLQAIGHNLRIFSQYVRKDTKIIAVIKASAYGSGSEELAKYLEHRKVSCLAVAYIDEGIQLRKAGIKLPIIILNPDRNGVRDMVNYDLEPEVYSLDQLREIIKYLNLANKKAFKIHLKLDTGMHRMGFAESDIPSLCNLLKNESTVYVTSIFSHLSSSEDEKDDGYTSWQVERLHTHYNTIVESLGYNPNKHILNSAGIVRFPKYHFDMVRLGLGLYGIDSTGILVDQLEKVHTMKANVIQIKDVSKGDFIGYNRKGKVSKPGKVAIINIGYADGLFRLCGNGRYSVSIKGKEFPTIGNVCMDLTIIDLGSNTDVVVGDEAVIFGKEKPLERLASVCGTIPYEILSRISSRIKRLYIQG